MLGGETVKASDYREQKGQTYTRDKYIHGAPDPRIVKFAMGVDREDYDMVVTLRAKEEVLVRDRALEAVRVAGNKTLEKEVGIENYFLEIVPYPHNVLRENKMMTGAGADRLQEGMRRAFGRPVGRAAALDRGEMILRVKTYQEHEGVAISAMKVCRSKIPKGAYVESSSV